MITKATIRLLRHATLVIEINRKKFLVDPMLSPKNALDPVQNCGNEIRFPMVDLPITAKEQKKILKEVDAVIITHLHRDHWDTSAQSLIERNKLIFCQPNDTENIKAQGFSNVQPIDKMLVWEGISIYRTNGQHGTGTIGKMMGVVSGFVFMHKNESIYLAGDTIWCEAVKNSLLAFQPKATIVNAGGAKFLTGDPITMTPDDIVKVHEQFPQTKIIAVHMDTVNHCFVTRADLRKALATKGASSEILIPQDGETITL